MKAIEMKPYKENKLDWLDRILWRIFFGKYWKKRWFEYLYSEHEYNSSTIRISVFTLRSKPELIPIPEDFF